MQSVLSDYLYDLDQEEVRQVYEHLMIQQLRREFDPYIIDTEARRYGVLKYSPWIRLVVSIRMPLHTHEDLCAHSPLFERVTSSDAFRYDKVPKFITIYQLKEDGMMGMCPAYFDQLPLHDVAGIAPTRIQRRIKLAKLRETRKVTRGV